MMGGGTRRAQLVVMQERYESPTQYAWIVNAVAFLAFGGLAGYVIAVQSGRAAPPAAPYAATTAPVSTPAAPIVDESQLRAYRDILARDPRNYTAAVQAANLLYDGHRYDEAIGFYNQAIAIDASDVSVSTDLGTALWYAGRPDEAIAQYDRSLALNATHAQTLFNLGIVRADGKHDYAGAVAAWEKLLAANAAYPEAAKVRTMIAEAKKK